MFKSRRKKVIAISSIVLLALFVVYYPYLFAWSEMCCQYQEVDIKSGRLRFTRYLFYCKVSEHIEESIFSKTLLPEDLVKKQPDWNRVNTFSPGLRHSPHHAYHGAISQIKNVDLIWKLRQFSPEAKRKAVQRVLFLWQTGGNYFAADEYLGALNDLTDGEGVVEVADISSLL